jgi:hypothetical protein
MVGDHTACVMLEAKDDMALRKMLPKSWTNATIKKLNKFTPEQISAFHAER